MELELLDYCFTVCKVDEYPNNILCRPFTFASATDREKSLVCITENAPENTLEREDNWRGLRITGKLDFSLTGILSCLLRLLSGVKIPVFAVSTFDTDYIFIKECYITAALTALESGGNTVVNGGKSHV